MACGHRPAQQPGERQMALAAVGPSAMWCAVAARAVLVRGWRSLGVAADAPDDPVHAGVEVVVGMRVEDYAPRDEAVALGAVPDVRRLVLV